MNLLLDTHMLLALGQDTLEARYPYHAAIISSNRGDRFGSAASIWEMNIKIGVSKLELGMPIETFITYLEQFGIIWLPVEIVHASTILDVLPLTRDPFDRMLLAQCQVEGMKLVTIDRLLAGHPLVAKI